MSAALDIGLDQEAIMAECLWDPVAFCQTFLHDHFWAEVPWVHRGLMAILTRRAEFLWKYGDLRKVVDNFVHERDGEENSRRQIFHVCQGERELNLAEIAEVEARLGSLRHLTSTEIHRVLLAQGLEIRLDLGPFTLIIMPRGSSKTTIAGLAIPLYKILYKEEEFGLYVSRAGEHSAGQLESIRGELSRNAVIREFFGDLRPLRSDDEEWSKNKFETITGIAMAYRGKGGSIRGVNHRNKRPTSILVDDPQNKDDVRSDTVKEEDKRWAFAELTPARERLSGKSTITVLGTYLGKASLVGIWKNDPRFTVVNLKVRDKDGDWIWPAYMNEESYRAERESFRRAGLLLDFHREYDGEDRFEDELPFQEKFFIWEPPPERDTLSIATYADLATSEKRTADFTVIITVGISKVNGLIHVLECHTERGMHEEDKIDEYFRQQGKWNSDLCGWEANAYQTVFGVLLRQEMFKRGVYFEVTPITHKTNKIVRIRGALRTRYASGYMRHSRKFPELEQQLLDFRYDDTHEHDDGPDALAAAVVLLDPAADHFEALGDATPEEELESLDDWLEGEADLALDWTA